MYVGKIGSKCNAFINSSGDENLEWVCCGTRHCVSSSSGRHSSLERCPELSVTRYPQNGRAPIYRRLLSAASLIFSWKVIYRFYRYRFYVMVITSVCTAPYLKPTYNGYSTYWEQFELRSSFVYENRLLFISMHKSHVEILHLLFRKNFRIISMEQ